MRTAATVVAGTVVAGVAGLAYARWEAQAASPVVTDMFEAEDRAFVAFCEAKYGIPSSDIHEAIDDGRLIESKEVCDWIFAHELLEG